MAAAAIPIATVAAPIIYDVAKKIFGFKTGGKVPKTGIYKLHKNEIVIPAAQVKNIKAPAIKALKKRKPKLMKR
jgi:hypothetical protein